jgi:hypothetical protein
VLLLGDRMTIDNVTFQYWNLGLSTSVMKCNLCYPVETLSCN